MKNLLKLPVLLLAVMLVASCGDSKKEDADGKKGGSNDSAMTSVQMAEADGKEIGELMCEAQKLMASGDMDKLEELGKRGQELEDQMKEKWGPDGNASDEDRNAFEKAMKAAMEGCM